MEFILVLIEVFAVWILLTSIAMLYLERKKELLYEEYNKQSDICRKLGIKIADSKEKYEDYIEDLGLSQTYRCTNSVVSNASNNEIKYLMKYSEVDDSVDSLEKIEFCIDFIKTHDKFVKEMSKLLDEIKPNLPLFIRVFALKFKIPYVVANIEWNLHRYNIYSFRFLYVSPAGKSSRSYIVLITEDVLKKIQSEICKKVNKKGHSKTQRSAMTNDLREAIKRRDNYTCCKCGNSVFEEPNLLLEVDHIIPISKGGKTEASNLQTLCWRCNREKSNK